MRVVVFVIAVAVVVPLKPNPTRLSAFSFFFLCLFLGFSLLRPTRPDQVREREKTEKETNFELCLNKPAPEI